MLWQLSERNKHYWSKKKVFVDLPFLDFSFSSTFFLSLSQNIFLIWDLFRRISSSVCFLVFVLHKKWHFIDIYPFFLILNNFVSVTKRTFVAFLSLQIMSCWCFRTWQQQTDFLLKANFSYKFLTKHFLSKW